MNPILRRARRAVIALSYALVACNSSTPTESESLKLAAKDGLRGKSGSDRFEVSPTSLDFGSTATTASVTLTNNTRKSTSWTASEAAPWLSLGAMSGSIPGRSSRTVGVTVSRSGLSGGSYTAPVTFSTGFGDATVTATMSVPGETAEIDVTPSQVDFGSTSTSAYVTLQNLGTSSLSWTASESASWLSLGATSGTIAAGGSKKLSLSANRDGMAGGTYQAGLVVTAGTAGADTVSVAITVASSAEVTLAGQLVDQFDGQGLGGLSVQYDGRTATTDAAGYFTIPGDATSNLQQLTISGSGVYKRITYATSGDTRWYVAPAQFDMSAFNDVARDEFGPGTVRWVSAPKVYIDSRPEGFTSDELSTWIAEVKAQVPAFLADWTAEEISAASITVTSSPPSDFTDGTIVIHFSENDADYNNTASIGYARLRYGTNGAIDSAAIWLRYLGYSGPTKAGKRQGILGHELGHAIGLGHMSSETESLMEPSIGSKTGLLAFDFQAASFHYTRSPENTAPDTDDPGSYDGGLAPAAMPAEREWVCW